MLFSMGNIITLIIVVLILLVYRQLDKNNRSLEKIKRYSDKVKDEIASFVDVKTVEIKDLGIELDVHQRTGKEILKRINSVEDELNGKTENLQELDTRINAYDSALKELGSMSVKVDENLVRLKNESEYVDTVGRRIKDANSRMQQIEKKIPDLTKDFQKQNHKELNELKENFIKKAIHKTIQRIETLKIMVGESEKSMGGFAEYLRELEDKRDVMASEIIEKIQFKFDTLNSEAEDIKRRTALELEENMENVLEGSRNQGLLLKDNIQTILEELDSELNNSKEHFDKIIYDYQDRANSIDNEFQERINKAAIRGKSLEDEIFSSLKTSFEQQAHKIHRSLEETLLTSRKEIDVTNKKITTILGDAKSEIAVWKTTIDKRMQDDSASLFQNFSNLDSEVTLKIDEIKKDSFSLLEKQKLEIDSFILNARGELKSIEETIKVKSCDLEELILEKSETLDNKIGLIETKNTDFEQNCSLQIQENNKNISDFLNNKTSELEAFIKDNLDKSADKLDKDILDKTSSLESLLLEYEGNISNRLDKVENIGSEIDSLLSKEKELFMDNLKESEEINTRLLGDLSEELNANFDKIKDNLVNKTLEIDNFVNAKETFLSEQLLEVQNKNESFRSSVSESIEKNINTLKESLSGRSEELNNFIDQNIESLKVELSSNIDSKVSTVESKLIKYEDEMNLRLSRIETFGVEVEELIESKEKLFAERIDLVDEKNNENTENVSREITNNISNVNEVLSERLGEIDSRAKDLGVNISNELESNIVELKSLMSTKSDSLKIFIEDSVSNIKDSLVEDLKTKISGIEQSISEYEESINYRFTKIEGIGEDINSLEGNLKELVQDAGLKVDADLNEFKNNIEEYKSTERESLESDLGIMKSSIKDLEESLDGLKQHAYENVSEKLKLFEDEFFKDFKDRSDNIQEKIDSWQAGIHEKLEFLSEESIKERERLEEAYRDSVGVAYSDARSEMEKSYSNLENQYKKDLEVYNVDMLDKLNIEKEKAELTFKEFSLSLNENNNRISDMIESSRDDLSKWQSDVLNQMNQADNNLTMELGQLKDSVQNNIADLSDSFESQKNELVLGSQKSTNDIKETLKNLANEINQTETDLKEQTVNALNEVKQINDSTYYEIQQRTVELQERSESTINQFNSSTQDIKDKIDKFQSKMFDKVEGSYKSLAGLLGDIEKKQKSYLSQTKIFERADNLKLELRNNLDEVKAEMLEIKTQAKDFDEFEKKILKVKKLGDDVLDKTNKFSSERRRIDEMENDFKKLMNISQSVDLKLDRLNENNDILQQVQISLRALQDLEKDVQDKYERLESKSKVLDSTVEGIDKNFEYLGDLEQNIKDVKVGVVEISPKLEDFSKKFNLLASNKDKTDSAVKNLDKLDSVLVEIEGRIEKMQVAREWLAKTETRLDKVNKKAEEQVKILGILLKDNKGSKKLKDNSSLSVNDVVKKLAHQGWSVKQIAQATNLSIGEVEIYLELLPKA